MSRRTIGFSAVAALLLASGCARASIETAYVPGAVFAVPVVDPPDSTTARPENAYRYLSGRFRLAPGSGSALVYHFYHRGALFVVDDESHEQITIEIPDTLLVERREYALGPASAVRLRYERGSSVWPTGCVGEADSGSVVLAPAGGGRIVRTWTSPSTWRTSSAVAAVKRT